MRALVVVQKCFDLMGISSKREQLNHITLSVLIIGGLAISLEWMYLILEADSSQEYMESIYVVTASTGIFFSFASTIFIEKKIFSFIDGIDDILIESKSNFNC